MPARKTSAPSDLLIDTMLDWLRPQAAMNWRMAMKSGQTVNRLKMRVAKMLTITVTTMEQEVKVTRAQFEKTLLSVIKDQKAAHKAAVKEARRKQNVNARARTKAKYRPWTWLENEHFWFAGLFYPNLMANEKSEEDAGEDSEWEGFIDDDDEVSEWEGFSDNHDEAMDVELLQPFPLKIITPAPPVNTRAWAL